MDKESSASCTCSAITEVSEFEELMDVVGGDELPVEVLPTCGGCSVKRPFNLLVY